VAKKARKNGAARKPATMRWPVVADLGTCSLRVFSMTNLETILNNETSKQHLFKMVSLFSGKSYP